MSNGKKSAVKLTTDLLTAYYRETVGKVVGGVMTRTSVKATLAKYEDLPKWLRKGVLANFPKVEKVNEDK